MSDHNQAIRMAQNLLRKQADAFKDVEVGYHQHEPNPLARGYRAAADAIDALIIPEENITRPTHLDEQATPLDPKPWLLRYGVRRFGMYDPIPSGVRVGELLWNPRDGFEQDRDKYPRGRIGDMRTTDYSRIQAGTMTAADTEILTGGLTPTDDREGSITLLIPAEYSDQVQRNEATMLDWGVHVTHHRNGTWRIEFPESTWQRYLKEYEGSRTIVQLTLREALPSQASRTWSFDAAHIIQRPGDQQ